MARLPVSVRIVLESLLRNEAENDGFNRLILLAGLAGRRIAILRAYGRYLRQALLITVLNPKAIVFYMAFFPLFIDPARHQGLPTYAAMALTIALITALWCLTLCAFAERIAARMRAHARIGLALRRLAGLCMIGFGLRLLRS